MGPLKILFNRTAFKKAAALLFILLAGGEASAGEAPGKGYELKGYYKNLLSFSETFAGKERFTSDLNRLRLEASYSADGLSLFAAYDNQMVLGDAVKTAEFKALKNVREDTRFDLSTVTLDRPDIFWSQSLYRLYGAFSRGPFTVTAGRQRVALGAGRIWNPEDLLNPVSPLQVERDERTGTDAVNMEVTTGPLSGVNFVFAPGKTSNKESFLLRARTNLRGYDFSGMLADFRRDRVVGFDFSGYVKDSGLRGEFTYTVADGGSDFLRSVVSFDHTFPSSLYLLIEYLFNGGNKKDLSNPLNPTLPSGGITTKNRNFMGIGSGYDITPLLRFDLLSVVDLDDKSAYLSPSLKYNILEDLDISAGAQFFTGKKSSEYGGLSDLYYAGLKWFF